MNKASGGLLDQARALLPDAIAMRRQIHMNPELGLDLPETRATVLESLQGIDIEILDSTTTSGLVAVLRGARPGPVLVLRGDMDALPMPEDTDLEFKSKVSGAMHACGHDSHVAMLAQSVRLLERHRGELSGTVKFMFQPGEEGFAGAKLMLDEGLLDDANAAFAIHIFPLLPNGTVWSRRGALLASADLFEIEIIGKGGHASMPHHAIDPIPVACELVQALQSFVTRRIDVFDPAVVTVARIQSGTTGNVIPETATIAGTIRTVSEATRATVHDGIETLARGIASAHGLEARVALQRGYPVTVNHPGFTDFALDAARDLLGEDRVFEQPTTAMGAEDWSFVLQRVPGAMVFLGVRPDQGEPAPCHSNRMVLNEEGMVQGIALHAAIALRYLDGEKRDFTNPGG